MIRTKRVFDPKAPEDGLRILITRYLPRNLPPGHYNIWHMNLAPSKELLKQYKRGTITWDEFDTRIRQEIQEDHNAPAILRILHKTALEKPITLLCYEPEGENCHRHIVKELIEHA